MLDSNSSIIALDVGAQRIGVASANAVARLAHPLTTLQHTADIFKDIQTLIIQERAVALVVGWPRGMDGQITAQTRTIEAFTAELNQNVSIPVYTQDEAVTSQKAEAELKQRGRPYAKGDIDALAATYILDDFLNEHPEIKA